MPLEAEAVLAQSRTAAPSLRRQGSAPPAASQPIAPMPVITAPPVVPNAWGCRHANDCD